MSADARTTHPPERQGVPVDLREHGLLWLINASVFHPRGFALALHQPTGEFFLLGDGTEAWHFDPDDEPTPDDLKARAEALFSAARAVSALAEQAEEQQG